METTRQKVVRGILLIVIASAGGCATVGNEFPVVEVSNLKIGIATQETVKQAFGAPWRVGLENGKRTWTYGYYRYYLFSPAITRDLVLRFNPQGILESYTYNTTGADE